MQRAFEVLDPENDGLMGWETWSELLMEVDPSLDMTQIRYHTPYIAGIAQRAAVRCIVWHVCATYCATRVALRGLHFTTSSWCCSVVLFFCRQVPF
jgi:hypothetical protein